jgi:hypothetical protein
MNYGMKVKLTMADGSVTLLRNVTEVHYCYDNSPRTAFESDIHCTGMTQENINFVEMEVFVETEFAEFF